MERTKRALAATLLSVAVLLLASPGQAGTIYPPSGGSFVGGTLTSPLLLPNGTAAAPSLAFTNFTGTGMWSDNQYYLKFSTAGTLQMMFNQGTPALTLGSSAGMGWGATGADSSPDVMLRRDAANTLALRNGTAAQQFNLYETYTDVSNFSRLSFRFSTPRLQIIPEASGTGVLRSLELGNSSGHVFVLAASMSPSSNDTKDLGGDAIGADWRHLYLLRSIQGSKTKALTESSATAAWDCALAAGAHTGGKLNYCVYAADATDYQERCADIRVSAVNKAGTTTCGISTVTGNATVNETTDANAVALSAGTLTYAVTCADTTDSFSISFNAVSSLTQTTLQSESRWDIMTPATCTPQ